MPFSLTVLFLGSFDPFQGFVTSRQIFAPRRHRGNCPSPINRPFLASLEPRFDAEITYLEITNDGMVRHPSFKRLVPWLRSRLRHSSGPHGSRLPEHLWEKVLFTMPIMSSEMSSAVLMFRNSAS